MKIVEIIRLETGESGTLSILRIDKQVFCVTLEPPDRLNERNTSSIPAGQYICSPYESPTHGGTFEVTNVPGRSAILLHAGNIVDHTEGCIMLGETFGKLKGNRAILNSGNTFRRFLAEMGRTPFHLTIYERY